MFNSEMTAHLAELSKIAFSDEELAKMTKDMGDIIALMDKVCGFDASKKPYTLDPVNYDDLRKDEFNDSSPTADIIKNASNIKNNSFVVPKVV